MQNQRPRNENAAAIRSKSLPVRLWATAILFSVAVVFLMAATLRSALAVDTFAPEIKPDPDYLPGEVVGIQMRALGNNDTPFTNAGIELTFRFASPGNRINTGPLEKFTSLFDYPAYQPMLDYTSLEVGEAEVRSDQARVPVTIETADGRRIVYLFALSLQGQEPYMNCWMTDSVAPIEISDADTPVVM